MTVEPSELPAQAETFGMYVKLLGAKGAASDAGRHAVFVEQAQAAGGDRLLCGSSHDTRGGSAW